ncbi:MAG TPA: glycerophosphodiester phosphodiesterase family protein [Methanocorpusculum sp.]|nr:glycerophosphodiester phosphodiesterase family protein [Methanocorpusculum sp.]
MNIVPLVVLCLVILFYLFLICPKLSRKAEMIAFSKQFIAHRGLWGKGAAENTLPAFKNAVKAGYGIELDVRLTRDGEVVVFHDDTLLRAAGIDRRIEEMTFAELERVRIFEECAAVPKFSAVLAEIQGKVPVIVELKPQKNTKELCAKTAALLDLYRGAFCIESFSPAAVFWFRLHRKHFLRGILTTSFFAEKVQVNFFAKLIQENLLSNFLTYPDFIACDVRHKKQVSQFICRYLFAPAVVFWTVQDEKTLKESLDTGDIFIFDSFVPETKPPKMVVKPTRNMKLD